MKTHYGRTSPLSSGLGEEFAAFHADEEWSRALSNDKPCINKRAFYPLLFAVRSLIYPPPIPFFLLPYNKNVVDEAAIEGKPITFEYTIKNLGKLPATRVVIREGANLAGLSLPKRSGNGTIIKTDVLPESTTTVRMVVVAESERVIPPSRAEVEYAYIANSGEEVTRKGHSTASKPVVVYNYDDYRKTFKDYTREYTLFTLGMAIPVLLPLGVWLLLSSSASVDSTKLKKK